MSTRKPLGVSTIGILIVGAVIVLALGIRGFIERSHASIEKSPQDTHQANAANAEERPAETGHSVVAPRQSERMAASPDQADVNPNDRVTVRVVINATLTPVAGAEVSTFDTEILARTSGRESSFDCLREDGFVANSPAAIATTDNDGYATLPLLCPSQLIVASHHSGLWGKAIINESHGQAIELVVRMDCTLRVRAIESGGSSGVADVPFLLRNYEQGEPIGYAVSDEKGVASFDHIQELTSSGAIVLLGLGFPQREPLTIDVPTSGIPAVPIPVALPPTGKLRIVVHDEHDRPIDGSEVVLAIAAFETQKRTHEIDWGGRADSPKVCGSGEATMPFVGLGLPLRITASPRDEDSPHKQVAIDVDGPQSANETIVCKLEWRSDDNYPVVVGRFVFETGASWPEAEVEGIVRVFPSSSRNAPPLRLHVSDDGRFATPVRQGFPDGGRRTLKLKCRRPEGLAGIEGVVDLSRPLNPGVTELGDIQLDFGPIITSGVFIDRDGRPLPGARAVLSEQIESDGMKRWIRLPCTRTYLPSEPGSFIMRALSGQSLPDTRLRLDAHCIGYLPGSCEFEAGQIDLKVTLTRAGGLAGSIQLDSRIARTDLDLRLEQGGYEWPVSIAEDGTFEQDAIPPGEVRLVVGLREEDVFQGSNAIVAVDSILIVSGEINRDPRIQGLVIPTSPFTVTVSVRDESGRPVANAWVASPDCPGVIADESGIAELRPDRVPTTVVVAAYGYRDVHLSGISTDQEVLLENGVQVRVSTQAKPFGIDPVFQLGLLFYRATSTGAKGDMIGIASQLEYPSTFDSDGTLTLVLPGPGTYITEPYASIENETGMCSVTIPVDPLPTLEVLDIDALQVFDVMISQEVLERVLRGDT